MTGPDQRPEGRARAPLDPKPQADLNRADLTQIDLTRTIEQIEGVVWPMPCCAPYLVAQSHALRRKPIGTFTTEDLRLMVDQDVGAAILKPLVLARLADSPLAEGAYYPGDLLEAAMKRWPEDAEVRRLAQEVGKR
ncbi:contact-dependent growth inhibition system immunity protein [Aliiroseovarius crassostreae]|uniref:contact-dependent growth inhibition system immunity protein n=1 Tax=Aliiroseovarius crassostreae TaxID=154981 RepID=UPI003C79D131